MKPIIAGEIVGWGRRNEIEFGPSPEWLALFMAHFRAWAATHTSQFGPPKLDGLSYRTRKLLRCLRLSDPQEVAHFTREELKRNGLGPQAIHEIERWLACHELALQKTG